jgi:uncharacterized iron-regulated protein
MRTFGSLLLLFFAAACATPARLVETRDDHVKSLAVVASALAQADVVVLGEQHDSDPVHRTHQELLRALHAERPNLVIAMEMFERDVQNVLLQYLNGLIDEQTFLAKSRPWPNYQTDYRPVIEFAKEHSLVVLAANAPRPLATKVSKQGLASVRGEVDVARETTSPEDEYWDAFVTTMGTHGGMLGEDAMKRFYAAQCLKDDTMAESIVDYLQGRKDKGDRPLVVLICGQFHSDYRRGTVARIQSRMPQADIRVLSSEAVDDLAAGLYTSKRTVGDYVVVVQKEPEPEPSTLREELRTGVMPKTHPKLPAASSTVATPIAASPDADASEGDTEGLRPALGLMPDYAAQTEGVTVAEVREGGGAEKAGIEAGDVIVELAGKPVKSMEEYVELLGTLKIGKLVPVRVRRGDAEVEVQVRVSARSR